MCFKQQVERREIIDTSTPFAGSKTQFLAIGKTLAPPSHEQQVCELISGISVQQLPASTISHLPPSVNTHHSPLPADHPRLLQYFHYPPYIHPSSPFHIRLKQNQLKTHAFSTPKVHFYHPNIRIV